MSIFHQSLIPGSRLILSFLMAPVVSLSLLMPSHAEAIAQRSTPTPAPQASPTPAQQTSPAPGSAAMQRLGNMFSPQIQAIINACWNRGKVNLSPQTTPDAPVICGDGSPEGQVTQRTYVDTVSDILAASSLVGFRAVMQTDPRLSPEVLRTFVSSSEGIGLLRSTIQTAITQSQLVASANSPSTTVLTEAVINRLVPVLRDPNGIAGLLGTQQQYDRVVRNFCTPPGMTVEQVKTEVPELNPLQFYAICIQESGVTQEVLPGGTNNRR